MKKPISLLIISAILWSCGGGGDSPPPPPVNKAPTVPTQSAPTNNLLCIDNTVSFQWNASSDPEGDTISYEMQVATDNQFTQNLQTLISTGTSTSVSLEKGVAYYWRIKAKDSKNASSNYSPTFNFYTEGTGETNRLPFSPALEEPALNAVVQTSTTLLKWTASDVDNDPLTYDIYFGTSNPPTEKAAENITAVELSVAVSSSQNYFWKVVVKDDKGGETIGQIWNFKTD